MNINSLINLTEFINFSYTEFNNCYTDEKLDIIINSLNEYLRYINNIINVDINKENKDEYNFKFFIDYIINYLNTIELINNDLNYYNKKKFIYFLNKILNKNVEINNYIENTENITNFFNLKKNINIKYIDNCLKIIAFHIIVIEHFENYKNKELQEMFLNKIQSINSKKILLNSKKKV